MRILVLDDNAMNRELARVLLEQDGHQVDEAATGDEFRAYLASDAVPDVLLLDILLPDSSGSELLAEARLVDRFRSTLAIALTAHARPDDRQRFREEGFDDVITKPIDTRRFTAQVEALLAARRAST